MFVPGSFGKVHRGIKLIIHQNTQLVTIRPVFISWFVEASVSLHGSSPKAELASSPLLMLGTQRGLSNGPGLCCEISLGTH